MDYQYFGQKIYIWQQLQFRKDKTVSEDDVPYGYGFFHFVFATGAMYFAMLLIGWNTHHAMKKYVYQFYIFSYL